MTTLEKNQDICWRQAPMAVGGLWFLNNAGRDSSNGSRKNIAPEASPWISWIGTMLSARSAPEILERRYVTDKIDQEEFEEKKRDFEAK